VGEEPVFVEIAGRDALLERVAVQEGLPARHLCSRRCAEGRRRGRRRCAFADPAGQHLELGSVERGHPVRHAAEGMLGHVGAELRQLRARESAVDVEADRRRQLFARRKRVSAPELQHQRQQGRGLRRRGVAEHREEAELAPLRGGLRVDVEALPAAPPSGGRCRRRPACSRAREPGVGGQHQLARRVVAAVADDAALLEHRSHLRVIRDRCGTLRQRRQRGRRGRGTCSEKSDDDGQQDDLQG
jgi:hypothetical protein